LEKVELNSGMILNVERKMCCTGQLTAVCCAARSETVVSSFQQLGTDSCQCILH
jgi:hypothetical protein